MTVTRRPSPTISTTTSAPKWLEHAFGVIAGRLLFEHGCRAGRAQAREQDRRLELRRSCRRLVDDRNRIARASQRHRQPTAGGARERMRAHPGQRIDHPLHRPLAQGRVAVKCHRDRARGRCAHHQATTCSGIAEIERFARLRKASDPDAVDPPLTHALPIDPCAQRAHRLAGIDDVLALKELPNPGRTDRQGAQNEGSVRDRLVARHADAAAQRIALRRGHRRSGGGMHQGSRREIGPSLAPGGAHVTSPTRPHLCP